LHRVPQTNTDEADWIAQTRRGVLELCLLFVLQNGARYGYELLTALARWPALEVQEGTLYPLLRRLERGGLLQSTWRESPAGPPRKYYSLSAAGRRQLERKSIQWEALALSVADLKRTEGRDEGVRVSEPALGRRIRGLNVGLKDAGGVSR
jgi:PadR family transcriptional regulator PadR